MHHHSQLIRRLSWCLIQACFAFLSISSLSFAGERLPSTIKAQLREDLRLVYAMQGVPSSWAYHSKFGKGQIGESTRRFIDKGARDIRFDPNDTEPGSPAYFRGTTIFLNRAWLDEPNALFRVSVIIHEAAHILGWNSINAAHIQCPDPYQDQHGKEIRISDALPLAGLYACDNSDLGSYGVQIAWFKAISKNCTNCPQKMKDLADRAADLLMERITDPFAQKRLIDDLYGGDTTGLRLYQPPTERLSYWECMRIIPMFSLGQSTLWYEYNCKR